MLKERKRDTYMCTVKDRERVCVRESVYE